jgi:hypothetical protein
MPDVVVKTMRGGEMNSTGVRQTASKTKVDAMVLEPST